MSVYLLIFNWLLCYFVCSISLSLIRVRRLWFIGHGGLGLAINFGTCSMISGRMRLAPISSWEHLLGIECLLDSSEFRSKQVKARMSRRSHENGLKCTRRWWTGCLLRWAILGDLRSEAGQILVGQCSIIQGHKCLILVFDTFNLLYLLLFNSNLICSISFNCSMSSLSTWPWPDCSRPNRKMGPLLTTQLPATTRYGSRWLVLATRVKYMAWELLQL